MMHCTLRTANLAKYLGELQNIYEPSEVEVGFVEGGQTADADPRITPGKTLQYIAQYAAYNEYGHDRAPARPFFHRAASTCGENWKGLVKKAIVAGAEPKQALEIAGKVMRDDVRRSITGDLGPWPANAESTRKAKTRISMESGEEKGTNTPDPLIWTGDMLRSVSYKITKFGLKE